ncbi:hypothetical protein CTI12_AA111030 [Artemisia annua]|uniref:CCHC-type domain-containing protein n=1 Tax=Artemisia annua TaxID=35608 RepID=A0A2U1PV16_ARTAN|nr:hypothetical protein CTI12_AA111030 [Artemisia annua]
MEYLLKFGVESENNWGGYTKIHSTRFITMHGGLGRNQGSNPTTGSSSNNNQNRGRPVTRGRGQPRPDPRTDGKCDRCFYYGHIGNYCPYVGPNPPAPPNNKPCTVCAQPGHIAFYCKVKCCYCNKTGPDAHAGEDCDIYCICCAKLVRHGASECPDARC